MLKEFLLLKILKSGVYVIPLENFALLIKILMTLEKFLSNEKLLISFNIQIYHIYLFGHGLPLLYLPSLFLLESIQTS